MLYPLVVLLFAGAGGAYLVLAVLPKITRMFLELQIVLPLPTRVLVAVSRFLEERFFALLGAAAALGLLGAVAARLPGVRAAWSRVLLGVPGLGQVVKAAALSRFLRVLAEGLDVGLPLGQALELSARALGSAALERRVAAAIPRAVSGAGLAASLGQAGVFPSLVPEVVRLGEETGTVPVVLKELASYYEEESDRAVKAAVAMLEPVMVFAVAGVVGFLALAIITPIYTMLGKLGGR